MARIVDPKRKVRRTALVAGAATLLTSLTAAATVPLIQSLGNVEFHYPVLPIIRHHHERWDGSGYPDGLKGEAIPHGARILAVADAFEALTSDRVYRSRTSPEQACAVIEAWCGIHYDP